MRKLYHYLFQNTLNGRFHNESVSINGINYIKKILIFSPIQENGEKLEIDLVEVSFN